MLIGYNTNIPHKGKMYHVQTEDNGLSRHTIVTLLYHEGAILRSRKRDYADLIGLPDIEERLRDLMKEQHKEMIKGLVKGKFDEDQQEDKTGCHEPREEGLEMSQRPECGVKPDAKRAGMIRRGRKSLDDILLDHISRKVKDR